jgi:hypothetical protein
MWRGPDLSSGAIRPQSYGALCRYQRDGYALSEFDAFEFPEGADLNVALTAFDDYSVAYQPSADRGVQVRQRAF